MYRCSESLNPIPFASMLFRLALSPAFAQRPTSVQ
jgi:hypothetical protein